MLCILKSHHTIGLINGYIPNPAWNGKGKVEVIKAWIASDSLFNGWILGSLSEEAVTKVVNRLTSRHRNTYFTTKDVWDELQRSYGPSPLELAACTISALRSTFDFVI
nr:ankyrin repeat-containing domain, PGG domain protein [Tanacetum cinerariifolium]